MIKKVLFIAAVSIATAAVVNRVKPVRDLVVG